MTKRFGKRLCAIFMAMCMILTFVPTSAFAAEKDEEVTEYHFMNKGEWQSYFAELLEKQTNGKVKAEKMSAITVAEIKIVDADGKCAFATSGANPGFISVGAWSADSSRDIQPDEIDHFTVKIGYWYDGKPGFDINNWGAHTGVNVTVYPQDLKFYRDGWLYEYYIPETQEEVPVDPTPETVSFTVEKRWAGNEDPNRPSSVSVNLLDESNNIAGSAELNENNNWTFTWDGLNPGNYAVEETTDLGQDYTVDVSPVTGDVNGAIITNTYNGQTGGGTVEEHSAQFFLRLDRTIPGENGNSPYLQTSYTAHNLLYGSVSGEAFVEGGTGLIENGIVQKDLKEVLNKFSAVQKVIKATPEAEALKAVVLKYFDVTAEQWNNDEIGVLWYVSKTGGGDSCGKHVDGVLYNVKTNKPVEPKPRVTYKWSSSTAPADVQVPQAQEWEPETTYTVAAVPTTEESNWTFSGWSSDDVSFVGDSELTFEMPHQDVTIVGTWTKTETPPVEPTGERQLNVYAMYPLVDPNQTVSYINWEKWSKHYGEQDYLTKADIENYYEVYKTYNGITHPYGLNYAVYGSEKTTDPCNIPIKPDVNGKYDVSKYASVSIGISYGSYIYEVTRVYGGTSVPESEIRQAEPSATIDVAPGTDYKDYQLTSATVDGKNVDLTTLANLSLKLSKKVKVVLNYTLPQTTLYDLTYNWNGNAPADAQLPAGTQLESGADVTIASAPTTAIAGWTFNGWDASALVDGKMPAGNAVITGSWTYTEQPPVGPTLYSLTYNWNGNAPADAQLPAGTQLEAGADVAVAGVPTTNISGWTFSGWNTAALVDGKMPAGNAVITGSWTYAPYVPPYVPPTNPVEPGNPDVEIPDADVPLAPGPDVDIPDGDVPLAPGPDVDIPDGDVPLAPKPEDEVTIIDPDVPLGQLPSTGADQSGLALGFGGLFMAVAAAWLVILGLKKSKKA